MSVKDIKNWKDTRTNWKEKLSNLMEDFRQEWKDNFYGHYAPMDINFDTAFLMNTGLSREFYNELNNFSINYKKEK